MTQTGSATTRLVTPIMDEAERRVWSAQPLLASAGTSYSGRIVSEVWADGYVCLAMDDPSLIGPALLALPGSRSGTIAGGVLPADSSMMPGRTDASGAPVAFLGRVVVELWSDRPPSVSTSGAEAPRLLSATIERLKQVA